MNGTFSRAFKIMTIFILLLALLPFGPNAYLGVLGVKIVALAIFAMSLDFILGYGGLVSFGHAAFYAIGAYGVAMFAPEYAAADFFVIVPAAIGASALAALLLGAFALRTRGVYFIMVTLALAQMVFFVLHDWPAFGGSDGLLIFARPQLRWNGAIVADFADPKLFYYACLGGLAVSFIVLALIVRSRFGRVLEGIRENEHRMQALGYATYGYKLAAFVIAGAFAGLGGIIAAYQGEYVSPALGDWRESGLALIMVALGGRGSLFGPVLGAAALVVGQDILSELTPHWQGALGLLIVLTVMMSSRGLSAVFTPPFGRAREPRT
ncbi:branched-chain amino acid ABC transporter permease [Varunaivibrio sulfuroxidans]|uniref:Amino acid/amide ABC transporter membrane protein 2 (HAAT family) n=1 Tax=Varunaivibrio sulfuroxidans TaxID=1773489 RepID=A0A4R3JH01_9PROT|nr:branched-chain amino acid ABC transporter permease [Varunaivibrio sulfuroxidans]TCS64050.1 amino acid/amide ABC transporter membrane protein 2 (HAAT family) [Varunaivibrio sulfuroxidans]WES31499.1 branched-chain amino acid ABC transporter permease [Varunaivibrio sulfuroxidans]